MREISVGSYPFEPTFKTAAAAIAHAKSYGPLVRAKADYQSIMGSQMVDAFWTDEVFVIRFSNQKYLHVFVDPKERRQNVQWRMMDNEPVVPGVNFRKVGAPAIVLNFPKGGSYVMDCSTLIAARLGKEIKRFFVNELGFFIHTPQQRMLSFGSVYRLDNHENLLYVFEDD
jgi:hypothetical protein